MQNNCNRRIRILGWFTLAAMGGLGLFWALLMLFARDPAYQGFFYAGHAGCTVFYILAALSAAALLFLGIGLRGTGGTVKEGSPLVFFGAAASALLFLVYSILLLILKAGNGTFSLTFLILAMVFSLPGAAYFVLLVLPEGVISPKWRGALSGYAGLSGTLACLCHILVGYFDYSLNMNSPMKAMEQFFFLVAAFFLLTEVGVFLGKRSFALYLPLASATVVLGFTCALGGILYFCVTGTPLYTTVLHDFFLFAITAYAGGRVHEQAGAAASRRCAFLEKMAEAAEEKARKEEERREALSRAKEEENRRLAEAAAAPHEDGEQQTFDFDAVEAPKENEEKPL